MVLSRSAAGIVKRKSSSMIDKTCLHLIHFNQKSIKKNFREGGLKHPMHTMHHKMADLKFK